jgi:hypothetical protein
MRQQVKAAPIHCHEGTHGTRRVAPQFLTSALRQCLGSRPGRFTSGEDDTGIMGLPQSRSGRFGEGKNNMNSKIDFRLPAPC